MRRIATALLLVAAAIGLSRCAADAPTLPKGNGNPPGGAIGLLVRLFTTNANPTAGFCAPIQAIVTLNGSNVPDGTSVAFLSDFGFFQQNSLPAVSIVTQNGIALTSICSNAVGVAKVRAGSTVNGVTATASLSISFQPSSQALPFFASCNPTFGPNTGGTTLTISGGRFFGDATTTRVLFTTMGITREAIVQSVTATTVTVLTPAFPEAISPSVPVDVTISFGTNTANPTVLSAPTCFVYGTVAGDTPSITSVLPSTGSNDGGTRVTIVGSGFAAPVQVFFGTVEAPPPISVNYNQIIVLSPSTAGAGSANLNATVGIRVHEVTSGKDAVLDGSFRYVTKLQLTGFAGANIQPFSGPFSPLTIIGSGFSAPMQVSLAGFVATVSSVSATELTVVPGFAITSGCADVKGEITVTNLNNGDTVTGLSFTYTVAAAAPVITGVSPAIGGNGTLITISGINFPPTGRPVQVTVGGKAAGVFSSSPTTITVSAPTVPPPACGATQPVGTIVTSAGVDIVVTDPATGCTATAHGAYSYALPCQ